MGSFVRKGEEDEDGDEAAEGGSPAPPSDFSIADGVDKWWATAPLIAPGPVLAAEAWLC